MTNQTQSYVSCGWCGPLSDKLPNVPRVFTKTHMSIQEYACVTLLDGVHLISQGGWKQVGGHGKCGQLETQCYVLIDSMQKVFLTKATTCEILLI